MMRPSFALLIVTLLAAVFAGCGNSEKDPPVESNLALPPTQTPTPEPPPPTPTPPPVLDLFEAIDSKGPLRDPEDEPPDNAEEAPAAAPARPPVPPDSPGVLAPGGAGVVRGLQATIDRIIDASDFSNAQWGVLVRSLNTGETLYARNEGKGMMPASNLKLYPCAVALAKLGPDFRYTTRLMSTDADLSDGVVNGDLYVIGSGDVSFTPRFRNGDALAPFREWAARLKEMGVQRIEGNIVGDDNVFDDERLSEGWQLGYLSAWYAAESGGLCLNDNCMDVSILPGAAAGAPARLQLYPGTGYGDFTVLATTTGGNSGGIDVQRELNTNRIKVTGRVALGSAGEKTWVTVHNPTLFFLSQLRRVLEKSGIVVTGSIADIDDLGRRPSLVSRMTPVAETQSPPLAEIVSVTLKKSQNLYADQLLKTLGARLARDGSFDGGQRVIHNFLKTAGVDIRGLRLFDGSGLSRLNLVQPSHTVALLETMYRHPVYSEFRRCMSQAGVDSSLVTRFGGNQLAGALHAKTGHIFRVLSISGYVRTRDGETLAFAVMLNNYTTSSARVVKAQNAICEALGDIRGRWHSAPASAAGAASASDAPSRSAARASRASQPRARR